MKDIFDNIKLLELEKYKIMRNFHNVIDFISDNINVFNNKYDSRIKDYDDKFDLILSKIDKVLEYKIVPPVIKKSDMKVFKKLFLIVCLILWIGIVFSNSVIALISVVFMIALGIVCIIYLDDNNEYKNKSTEYQKKLKKYKERYNDLVLFKNELDNSFIDEYNDYLDKLREYEVYKNKCKLIKDLENDLSNDVNDRLNKIDDKLDKLYASIKMDKKYYNYFCISIFCDYLKNNKGDSIDNLVKLFNQEYSYIINDTNGIINNINNNKLKEDCDDIDSVKIDDLLEDLLVCLTEKKYVLEDIVLKFESVWNLVLGNNFKKSVIKKNTDDVVSYDTRSKIILDMLDNNKDSVIEGLKYYYANRDSGVLVSDDVRTYILKDINLPKDKKNNKLFPHGMVKHMLSEIKNNFMLYSEVKIDKVKIEKINDKVYKFRKNSIVYEIDLRILKDTISLLGDKSKFYVFKDDEPIYVKNDREEIAILMSNLRKK